MYLVNPFVQLLCCTRVSRKRLLPDARRTNTARRIDKYLAEHSSEYSVSAESLEAKFLFCETPEYINFTIFFFNSLLIKSTKVILHD